MKIALFISALAVIFSACSSSQNFTRAQEDDIYYVPGKRSLFVQEVKKKTGVDIVADRTSSSRENTANDKTYPKENDNSVNPKSHAIGMARYATEKQVQKEEERTGQTVSRIAIPEGDGYWLGGFKGSDNDLEECVRIMNRYPEGFAYFGNGYEIAQNLSFSPDWNVFTLNGRYWWFPTNSNISLYNELIFGNYPKYAWTMIWNDPRFDSFAWSNRVSFGWDRWGWRGSFGWGSGWGYDPFWNNYGYYGFYDPWGWNSWGPNYGYYPGWGYPHWGHRPGWGHHGPNWGYHRPGWGGSIERPTASTTRYAPKKQYTSNRNARSYSTYSRTSRSSSTSRNSSFDRGNSGSTHNPSYNSGSYSRGNSSGGSYGSSSSSRSSSGRSGSVERTNTGSRR
ncbi:MULTISPECIES: hypothetical protein [Butyricimonas]|uniref:hypothetical protein n=1 Tax=Butyricimonas TaxID=574697 RepID=UPI0007FB2BB4|nr:MULTISPECIES: hypothetical protein [Butyricimonas]